VAGIAAEGFASVKGRLPDAGCAGACMLSSFVEITLWSGFETPVVCAATGNVATTKNTLAFEIFMAATSPQDHPAALSLMILKRQVCQKKPRGTDPANNSASHSNI
jgi:hypothetical protein